MPNPLQTVYFMDTSAYAPGIFDSLFGGLFLIKGVPLAGQLLWILSFSLALWAAYGESQGRRTASNVAPRGSIWTPAALSRLAIAAALTAFTLSFFFLLQPWDEVFINLRHSLHLAENGIFSFNRGEPIEGTVDWLVYALLGLLHRTGFPLEELAFVQGYLGALACIFFGQRLWRQWSEIESPTIPILLMCFYPPLAFNSAHGFATTWFVALLLAAAAAARRFSFLSIVPLALIPLVRAEGILFFALLAGLAFYREKSPRRAALLGLALLPFIALCIWRYSRFGSLVPLPILYKATGTSLFYFVIGIRNLFADLIACGSLLTTGVLLYLWMFKGPSFFHRQEHEGMQITLLFATGCLPYYLSGGDWFPSYWGRYLLPFSLWTYLLVTAIAWRRLDSAPGQPESSATGRSHAYLLVTLTFLVHSLWPLSSTWKFIEQVFSHRRTLAKIHAPTIGRGHYRIQHLSQLGLHLGATTRREDVIASSEVATIMYFARRETLDLLGVANVEIARSPVREAPSLLRKFPQASELPYLIFKRIRTDILPEKRPEFLYTFDFMWRDLMPEVPLEELTEALFFKAIGRWEIKLGGLMDVLYGGLDKIVRLGYAPVVVRYSNHFLSMYFVRSDRLEPHLERLEAMGFHRNVFWDKPKKL